MHVNSVKHQFPPDRTAGLRRTLPIADFERTAGSSGAEEDLLDLGTAGSEEIALLALVLKSLGSVPVIPDIAAVHTNIDCALLAPRSAGIQIGVIAYPDPRDIQLSGLQVAQLLGKDIRFLC